MATFDINDVARRVQYTSTGQTGPFSFTFQVNASSELLVYIDDTVKTETTHYTVSLNANGTGSVTFTTATTSGELITIIGDQPLSRTTVFQVGQVNQPTTLETEFDNTLIRQQQIKEITDRSIQLKPSTGRIVTGSGTSGPLYFPYNTTVANNANRILKYDSNGTSLELGSTTTNIDALAAIASDITTVSGISSNVTTVAGIASNVTSVASNASNINTVATNIANVNTVAGISSNVTTVAGLSTEITALSGVSSQDLIDVAALGTELQTLAPIASDITTVAGVSGNVTTVAGISSDVSTVSGISANTTTVAGISANVTTVAGISSDVSTVAGISANVTTVAGDTANIATVAGNTANINTVATNIIDVNTFANRYRISATDPTTSLDVGDLYYDTTNDIMKVYGSSGWQNAGSSVNGTSARFQYSVSSSTTTITGTDDNGNTLLYDAGYVDVYLNGIKMVNGSDVTVTSGSSVVFATAIGTSGTDTVDIIAYGTFNVAAIDATSITSGTLGFARGGTGLGSLGSADEVLQMNAGGTALEYGKVDTANIADDAVGATQLNVSGNGTSGQMLTSDGDGSMSWVDQPSAGLTAVTLTGTTPTIDWSAGNLFTHTLTGDTTYTFSNVSGAKEIELFLKNVGNYYDPDAITSTPTNSYLFTSNTNAYNGSNHLSWADDGSKMYLSVYQYSTTGYTHVLEYDASTAYDITTLTLNGTKTVTQYYGMPAYGQVTNDGNHFFGASGENIRRYDFGTAYDVTTLNTNVTGTGYDQQLDISTSAYTNWDADFTNDSVRMIRFNEDGTKMCVVCAGHKASLGSNIPLNPSTALGVQTFSLSTGFDLTSTITKISGGDLADAYASIPDSVVKIATMNNEGTVLTVMLDEHNAATSVPNTYRIAVFVMKPFDPSTLQFFKDHTVEEQGHDTYTGTLALATNDDGSKLFMGETNSANDTAERSIFEFPFATDYTITLPNNLTPLAVAGSSASPSATSYLRIVTPDGGTNYYITSEQELL